MAVLALLSSLQFLQRPSAALLPPDAEKEPWFAGCLSATGGFCAPGGARRDLDPVACSARCLDEGYYFAALTPEDCCCGNRQHGLVASECANISTSCRGAAQEVRGGGERVFCLPGGGGPGGAALYRAEGPFLRSVRLSASPDAVHAGRAFVVEVSGKLAGRSDQPTGIPGLRGQDLSYVTVELHETTPEGQSSHRVAVSDDGSFVLTSDWILETPGKYELNVSVSNPLSSLSSALRLSVLQPPPRSLLISLSHGPLGVPPLTPSLRGVHSPKMEAAYLGDPVTLRAHVCSGPPVEFSWAFTREENERNAEGKKAACLPSSDCLSSTVNWTFETEGVYMVSVNASGASGWTQERMRLVVVRQAVSDLTVSVSGDGLTSGEGVSMDTTTKHRLIFNLTLSGESSSSDLSSTDGGDFSNDRKSGAGAGDGDDDDDNVITRRHAGARSRLCSYDGLRSLRESAVSTRAGLSLGVVGPAGRLGPGVTWAFSLGGVVVMNRTTDGWDLNTSLTTAGCYEVTVKAFSPTSWASFSTHILAQDPVGALVLKAPSVITARQNRTVSFSVAAGSDVTVSLLVNATLLYRNGSYATGEEAAAVLLFDHTGTVVVELRAENRVSSENKSARVCVEGNGKPSPQVAANPTWQPPTGQSPVHSRADNVWIYAAEQAYPTNTDVVLMAVAAEPDPVEFLWHFGDASSARTTSRTITKRYHQPGRYDVSVAMAIGRTSRTSAAFPLVVQRAVKLHRLLHQASVLRNQTVTVSCRVGAGTDATFLWSFGDGTSRLGRSTEHHVFHRTGEFRVTVTVSNLVSTASLTSHIFVVDRYCQPPPVKNMGPLKLQVSRCEVIRLGVTFEAELDCDVPGGLRYTWTLLDSAGRVVPLPLVDAHRQDLVLPSHFLRYDTYVATARVRVTGSVVYSNYSVGLQVRPSPPVAVIQGGTNVFVSGRNATVVTLDGRRSRDPDFPASPVSFSWTCEPVSSISSSCFQQDVATSSPVLAFPASSLKPNFDQFKFSLTVHSGGRSASSETFLTVTPKMIGKVSVYCPQCQGDQVRWDQSFFVSALCEGCDISPNYIQFTWSLYTVNASSRPVTEVPFCHTVDLSAPSTVVEGPAASPQTHGAHAADAPQRARAVSAALITNASETGAKKLDLNVSDSGTSSKNNRKKWPTAGGPEPDPSPLSSVVTMRTAGSGDEPFHHPLGEPDPPQPSYSSAEYQPAARQSGGVLYSDRFGQSDVSSEFPNDLDYSADGEPFSFPIPEREDSGGRPDSDYDVPLMGAEEGDPGISAGRPTGLDGESFGAGEDSVPDPASPEDKGSNLVHSRPPAAIQEPILLDLPRDPVDRGLLESYALTGISSPLLHFRPFSLRPGSRYMLEVTAKSHDSLLGRTQLFLKTTPAPKGIVCQVQPVRGVELYTHFSIFCSSGKEDLVYEVSVSVGGGAPPRTLYQGRDFQYYFSLPSGDPNDDYKVTIYTEIRSGTHGAATKPCPVTVQVQPSFLRDASSPSHLDPDLELSEAGLRNLSALVRLGNGAEVRNYVSVLSGILNRLSHDAGANAAAQRRIRNVLICTACELESSEQVSMEDNINILKNLLQVTSQVTFASARQVTDHVQAISERFSGSSAPIWYDLGPKTLDTLVGLLSHSLQAAVASNRFPPGMSNSSDIKRPRESDSHDENAQNGVDSSSGAYVKRGGSIPARRASRLVADILQTASDLMLKFISSHEVQGHRVSAGLISVHATHLNQSSVAVSGGSGTFHVPAPLIGLLFAHRKLCVLAVVTELTRSPYTWAHHPGKLSAPVVELSLFECSTRGKIPVRSLVEPVNIELQQPPRDQESSLREYILLRTRVNYHSFNITQEHLQQAIQISVVFMPLLNKAFPIMLLFRMFEKPTPSMHHLLRIHQWEGNTTRFTLPPSYLSGVGHLALLNAEFGKDSPGRKYLSKHVNYSLTVESSLCVSWNAHPGGWTRRGCSTRQADSAAAVNCSCFELRPLTVVQQQIQCSHDTADLDPFLSVSSDVTVVCVLLLLCVCVYVPGLVVCKRADLVSAANQRVHYLHDNSPCDQFLYAVTIHTGLCSAARMSAKVYIVLHGEYGVSQTRELQVPGCSLFRRNSRDSFILSAAHSLGPVWGVHIWHDNSGPSPTWSLVQVEVSEVSRGQAKGRPWLFVGPCWLAANRGDGRVERTLRVCTRGIGFAKMLSLKLPDYLADHHLWVSVHSCPCPNAFTRAQRLGVSLLLLLGYACVNAAIISQTDAQLPRALGVIDVSAVSVTTGLFSVVAVLPAAGIISILFRLRQVEPTASGIQRADGGNTGKNVSKDAPSATDSPFECLRQCAQETTDLLPTSAAIQESKNGRREPVIRTHAAMRKEDAPAVQNSTGPARRNSPVAEGSGVGQGKGKEHDHGVGWLKGKGFSPASQWCHYLAWTLCVLLSFTCLVLSALLGARFSSSEVLLWMHSLFFSLVSCVFLIQPVMIITVAVAVSFWYRKRADFHSFSSLREFEMETSELWSHTGAHQPGEQFEISAFPQETRSYFDKLLGARQRARRLRFVRPPTAAELRKTRGRKRRETLIHNTLRDLSVCGSMLFLMLCINYGSSFTDYYHLNKAVRKRFLRGHDDAFMSIQKHEDWWEWAQTRLLNSLYKNTSATPEQSYALIGEPILWKTEASSSFQGQVSSATLFPECLRLHLSGTRAPAHPPSDVFVPMATPPRTCGQLGCYVGTGDAVSLGHTKSDAASRLKLLRSGSWLGRRTVAVKVQFTLFSPAPNLFTSVTSLAEQSPIGVLLPSAKVQSVRVHHTPAVGDYAVMVCQLLFLVLSLLQLCNQVYTVVHQGLMGYWKTPSNWLEVTLLTVILAYYFYYIYHSVVISEVVALLQRHSCRAHVDVGLLATWEQHIRALRGATLFLLAVKCVAVSSATRMLATSATLLTQLPSRLLRPTIAGLVLMVALSCVGNLLLVQSSWAFSSLSRSLRTLMCHYWGLRAIRALHLSGPDLLYPGVVYLSSTVLCTAVVICVASSLVRSAKTPQSRTTVLTVAEIAGYIRRRVSGVTRKRRQAWTENHEEGKTCYFEEFESLVDELLFRLNALSSGLPHTLPPKPHRQGEEDGPVVSLTHEPGNMDAQDSVRAQTAAETAVEDHTRMRGREEALPAFHPLGSRLELEVLQRGGKAGNASPLDPVEASDKSRPPGTRAEETPKDGGLQASSKTQNRPPPPESASPIGVWAGDAPEEHVGRWTETKDSCWLGESQAAHREVVVEVLIHEQPVGPLWR